ncbi:MAG: hypothetical protein AAF483_02610 [Planctomycetota bacterium]
MKILFCVLVIVPLSIPSLWAQDSAASVLESWQLNCASLERADVVIRFTESVEQETGFRSTEVVSRFIFDLTKEKAFQASTATLDVASGERSQTSDAAMSAVVDGKSVVVRRWPKPGHIESYREDSFTASCAQGDLKLFGLLGVRPYLKPVAGSNSESQSYEEHCSDEWALNVAKSKFIGPSTIELGPFPTAKDGITRHERLVFSSEKDRPKSRTTYYSRDNRDTVNSKGFLRMA